MEFTYKLNNNCEKLSDCIIDLIENIMEFSVLGGDLDTINGNMILEHIDKSKKMLETKPKIYNSHDLYNIISELLKKYSKLDDTVFDRIFQIIDSNPEELIYIDNEADILPENIHSSFSDNDDTNQDSTSESSSNNDDLIDHESDILLENIHSSSSDNEDTTNEDSTSESSSNNEDINSADKSYDNSDSENNDS